ncbi:hypothetical protein A0H81_00365 [Grifola frondosa]|uniref:Uncharacterized protein n=1 Tax=Grifola frondosa TaxID=5627 RepID=A0A1C7MPL4_GRIFR|nr:hypothetical protein A0H81_00365 [Grifola frondosa]
MFARPPMPPLRVAPALGTMVDHPMPAMLSGATLRRRHHHKHSLSYNFFSFLELRDLHTPVPLSPWAPISSFSHRRLWVAGEQVGSLACTGLGYWVFDVFGVALGHVLLGYLA